MKQINLKFDLHNARNAEHYQFHYDVLSIITDDFASACSLGSLRAAYQEAFDLENGCYLRNTSYKETPEVEAADKKRDDLFLYISQMIKANLLCPVETTATAAKRMDYQLAPYKDAPRMSYSANTAAVTDFVAKMQEEGIREDIATLGLTSALTELDNANRAFNTVYNTRSAEALSRTVSDNMKSVRPKVDAAYKELASAVNALYQANLLVLKDETTDTLCFEVIDGVNAIILRLQETLSRAGVGPKPNFSPHDKNPSGDSPAGGGDDDDRPVEI